jgi:hypothetical protein
VIEEEEKTLMMIVGQEGRGPKWWVGRGRLSLIEAVAGVARGEGGGGNREQGGEGEGEERGLECDGQEGRVRLGMLEMRREGRDRRV